MSAISKDVSVLLKLLIGARREERGRFPKETSVRIHESILCGSLLLERHFIGNL